MEINRINKLQASMLLLISILLFLPFPTEQVFCFSNDTIFLDNSMHPINASSVQNDDLIQSLKLEGGKWIMTSTKVNMAVAVEGPFNFVRIQLQQQTTNSTAILTVTEDHGLIILDELAEIGGKKPNQLSVTLVKTIPAKIIKTSTTTAISQNQFPKKAIGNTDIWAVKEIEFVELPQRYVIQTEAGTALASNLLTTTSCLHGEE